MGSLEAQMSSLGEQLHSIIDDKVFAKLDETEVDGEKCLVLSESGQPNSQVTLLAIPDNLIVLKSDMFMPVLLENPKRLSRGGMYQGPSFFKQGSGAGKRADYILLDENAKRVVFWELTEGSKSRKEIQAQLTGAHAVLDYIRRVVAHFLGMDFELFIGRGFSYHFAAACKTSYSMRKRNTQFHPQVNGSGNSEENFKKFSGYCRFYYGELVDSSIS